MRLNKNYELSDLENIKYLYFEDKLYEPNIRKAIAFLIFGSYNLSSKYRYLIFSKSDNS